MKRPWQRRRRQTTPPDDEHATIVLGAELAAARAREAEVRAAHPDLTSPVARMYDFWAGETDLARFVDSPTDAHVSHVVDRSLRSSDDARDRLRASLTLDDLYTVLTFSRRLAVKSLRTADVALAREALAAISLIDIDRVDWRDVPGTIELAAYAVARLGGDLMAELDRLADLAQPKIEPMIAGLISSPGRPELRSAGYATVMSDHGFGLVDSRGGQTSDLGQLLVRLADAIDRDDYRTASITLTDDGVPPIWFPERHRQLATAVADRSSASGNVHARHRPGHPHAEDQQFTVFVLQVASSDAATDLARLAQGHVDAQHASLALHEGPVFALTVARSVVMGVDNIESTASLERFREPFTSALRSS